MKPIKNSRKFLALAVCMFPLLSNAMAIDTTQPAQQQFKQQTKKRHQVKNQSCCQNLIQTLSPAKFNANLTPATYLFGSLQNSKDNSNNKWSFSLAQNSQIELGLLTLDLDWNPKYTNSNAGSGIQLELFDSNNKSLGSVGKNSSLNLLLAANVSYSFAVSGAGKRKINVPYVGALKVNPPSAVPLGDALPMFTASLLMLGFKLRSRFQKR